MDDRAAGLMRDAPFARFGAKQLSDLIHRVYEAGTSPSLWCAVMGEIAASMNCSRGLLFTPYHAPQHGGFIFPFGIGTDVLEEWATTYIDLDVWAKGGREKQLWRTGEVLVDKDMASFDELLSSRFYVEFLSRIDIGRVCVGCVFDNSPGLMATSLAVFKSIEEPAFTSEEMSWLKLVVPHVSRSLGVMQRLDIARTRIASLTAVFDRSDSGIVLLDAAMRVQYMNSAARCAIDRNDGLVLHNGKLDSLWKKDGKRLGHWLEIERAGGATAAHFTESFSVPKRTGGLHYIVQVSRLMHPAGLSGLSGEVRSGYLVLINDPEAFRLPAVEQLMNVYALTHTQAKVSLALAQGKSYGEVAECMGVSEETIRSHIKEIYPKMRVNRQVDLVRLISSLGRNAI